jgi:hypothetical protein
MNTPEGRIERIRKKAYELYLQRGKAPGHEMEDWIQAEKLVDSELNRERKAPRTEASKPPAPPAVTPIRSTSKVSGSYKRASG